MKLLAFHCRAGQHTRCPAAAHLCKCPCHERLHVKELSVTDPIAQSCQLIEDRITEIDDELGRYDDLRAERKTLEVALRKLRPGSKQSRKSPRRDDAGLSLAVRILAIVAKDPKTEWSLTDLTSQLELSGWTTTSDSPSQVIRPTCDKLVRGGELDRPRAGAYKAVA